MAYAKLVASYDIGNPSEAEAMNAARLIRRRLWVLGLRFVDVMERADVKEALDALVQPVREDRSDLNEAFVKITELAELLAKERETVVSLRAELARNAPAGAARAGPNDADAGLVNGVLVAMAVLVVTALLIAAALR